MHDRVSVATHQRAISGDVFLHLSAVAFALQCCSMLQLETGWLDKHLLLLNINYWNKHKQVDTLQT